MGQTVSCMCRVSHRSFLGPVLTILGRSCGGPDAAVLQSVVLQGMQMASIARIAFRVMLVCR